jgi:hypothetical protein
VSNRKAHRRENSFRRTERFVPHPLRRPARSGRHARRKERRSLWKVIHQWLTTVTTVTEMAL